MTRTVRPRPCSTCPYRRNVPSGVWAEEEYRRLPTYDGPVHEQTTYNVFLCHGADGQLCAGWCGHRDPADLLAVRIGLSFDHIDPSVLDYTTDVPLFGSGAEAMEHGLRDIDNPTPAAQAAARKLMRKRELSQ